MHNLSFVIPCYKCENTIVSVINEIFQTISKRNEYDCEIILVNDCSPDNTRNVINDLAKNDKRIKTIHFSKNFGQHSALIAGYKKAIGSIVISLDDDGQTPANQVFELIDQLNDGYDVVFASYDEKKHGITRNIGSKINDKMAKILINKPKNLYLSSYFVAKDFVIKEVIKYNNPYPYISGLILRVTSNICNVPVKHRVREVGKSGYTLGKLISLWLNGFTAFSVKPLRIATVTGFICAVIGFLYGLWTIINKLFIHVDAPLGYSSLMATLVFIGGMIMLILGLIGEYIGRIYISINNAPQYVIKEKLNCEKDSIYDE